MYVFNVIMALIMPSVVALLFYSKIQRIQLSKINFICTLTLFLLSTNSVCYAILVYFNKIPSFDMLFTLKYSVLATFFAFLIALIYRFIEIHITIKLKVEQPNEKA